MLNILSYNPDLKTELHTSCSNLPKTILDFAKLCILRDFFPQPSIFFTRIYPPYLWHFATLGDKIFGRQVLSLENCRVPHTAMLGGLPRRKSWARNGRTPPSPQRTHRGHRIVNFLFFIINWETKTKGDQTNPRTWYLHLHLHWKAKWSTLPRLDNGKESMKTTRGGLHWNWKHRPPTL